MHEMNDVDPGSSAPREEFVKNASLGPTITTTFEDSDDDSVEFVEDEFYCEGMDDDDETWKKHILRKQSEQENITFAELTEEQLKNSKRVKMKVRTKDKKMKEIDVIVPPRMKGMMGKESNDGPKSPVLQCPLCFTTICMDCQAHEKFEGQYRAMFVMNIIVDWETNVNDAVVGGEDEDEDEDEDEGGGRNGRVYYKTQCCSCGTVVAGLDMKEEVYYFFDVLASS